MNKTASYLLLVTSAFLLAPQTDLMAADTDAQKAVLITGASTGIGRNAAETRAKAGYFVYAGARKPADIDFLFDVNIYGVYRITKAFAPMIIESQGRIVNISSISE